VLASAAERTKRALAAVRASQPNIALTALAADRAGAGLAIVREKYAEGVASYLALLDAQEQLIAARQRAAVAEHTHLANIFSLQRALSHFDWRLSEADRRAWLENLERTLGRAAADEARRP
jgi:outer membrane protein TolC